MRTTHIRDTGLNLTELSFGTSSLGNMTDTDGNAVPEERAQKTLDRFFHSPSNLLDTSRNYGQGHSEARIGRAVARRGGWPQGFYLSTKLDRDPITNRFDADRAQASLEESLTALHLSSVDILHLHDPEYAADLAEITQKGGALDLLFAMKKAGLTKAVGLAMGRIDIMMPLLQDWDFDVILNHNRYTLLNREADAMYDLAASKGTAIINAAPFSGGILAKGPKTTSKITYQEASKQALEPVHKIERLCADFNVEMGAAALQFSLRDDRIASTLCGVTSPQSIDKTLAWAKQEIPEEFWKQIAKLPYSTENPEANRSIV